MMKFVKKNKDRMKCDQMFGKKFVQFLEKKIAKTVAKPANPKIFSSMLNIKTQNTYVQAPLKLKISYNKPCFKTAYLC